MPEVGAIEEIIVDTLYQRLFRADKHHVNGMLEHEVRDPVEIRHLEWNILAVAARARITWSDIQLGDLGALGYLPGERTFPAACANDKDIHPAKIFFLPIFTILQSHQIER